MDVNKEIKELKTEFGKEMIGSLLRGKLDKTEAIVRASSLIILQMLDAYTTVHPIVLPPKPILPKLKQLPRSRRRKGLRTKTLLRQN